jgi:Skp family chaperone for outer membrane proteins
MIFNFRVLPVVFLLLAGCAQQPAAPDALPIAAVHTTRCGHCHVAPERNTRTRAELEDAFGRHKHRLHLSQDEWQAMIDFLAAPPAN